MKKLFSQIRRQNYQANNLSAQEFRLIIRQIIVDSITTDNKEEHCEEDIDCLLYYSSNISKIKCLRIIILIACTTYLIKCYCQYR